jgi:hypothetical protein
MLVSFIPMGLIILAATRLTSQFGYLRVVRISAFVFMIAPLLINFKLSIVTLGLFCCFLPISAFAISSIPVVNCLWTQFPKDMGKATGIAIFFFSMGSIIWSVLFMKIINPNNDKAIIDADEFSYFS